MIDENELTETEKQQLKFIALSKRKEQLEQEIEDMKLKGMGFKQGKKSYEQLKQYFKD